MPTRTQPNSSPPCPSAQPSPPDAKSALLPFPQALSAMSSLQSVELAGNANHGFETLLAPTALTLSALASGYAYPLHRNTVTALFPEPAPLKRLSLTLDIKAGEYDANGRDANPALSAKKGAEYRTALLCLAERLPQLTSLQLSSSAAAAGLTPCMGPATLDVAGMSAHLRHLREVSLGGSALLEGFAPLLPALPALTRLELSGFGVGVFEGRGATCRALGALGGLRQLRLAHADASRCHAAAAGAVLAAVRELSGLQVLELDGRELVAAEALGQLVPPPPALRKLVVGGGRGALGVAERLLGGLVQEVCSPPE